MSSTFASLVCYACGEFSKGFAFIIKCFLGCIRFVNWRLIKYFWNFAAKKGKRIEILASKYPKVPFHVLQPSSEAKRFFVSLVKDIENA